MTATKVTVTVKSRKASGNGVGNVAIGLLGSDRPELSDNELLTVLHTMSHTHYLDPDAHAGFDYTLGFPLAGREGFPYALDMTLQN